MGTALMTRPDHQQPAAASILDLVRAGLDAWRSDYWWREHSGVAAWSYCITRAEHLVAWMSTGCATPVDDPGLLCWVEDLVDAGRPGHAPAYEDPAVLFFIDHEYRRATADREQ